MRDTPARAGMPPASREAVGWAVRPGEGSFPLRGVPPPASPGAALRRVGPAGGTADVQQGGGDRGGPRRAPVPPPSTRSRPERAIGVAAALAVRAAGTMSAPGAERAGDSVDSCAPWARVDAGAPKTPVVPRHRPAGRSGQDGALLAVAVGRGGCAGNRRSVSAAGGGSRSVGGAGSGPARPCRWSPDPASTAPAALAPLGHRVRWPPRILDRVLPNAEVEGEALSRRAPAHAAGPDAAVRRLPAGRG